MNLEFAISLVIAATGAFFIGLLLARSRAAAAVGRLQSESDQRQREFDLLQSRLNEESAAHLRAASSVHELRTELAVAEQKLSGASDRFAQQGRDQDLRQQSLKDELQQQRKDAADAEARAAKAEKEFAVLRSTLLEKEQNFAQQLKQLEENKVVLKNEFENLANQIFEVKGKSFTEQNRKSLDELLNPFKQQINDFKSKVESVHIEGTKQQAEVRTELKQLQTMHQQMTTEAHNLATALKGQKKMQGNWGELVLENVLDLSGLRLGHDYKREVSFTNEEGGRSRPDVVVYLPQGKHLVIDAKVSLNAYTRYVNAEDELERNQALKEHADAVAARIKELADRDYYKLHGINSPEIVFMFIPIESAFVEALKADSTLFQKAIEQNVLVATPTTLLTSLNIVRQLWRFEDQNKHTAELARKAEGVFKKLKGFLTSFEGVKKGLDKAQESYAKAEGQLVSGSGNLVKQVNDFKNLAPAIKDQLPEYFTEKAVLELVHLEQGEVVDEVVLEVVVEE